MFAKEVLTFLPLLCLCYSLPADLRADDISHLGASVFRTPSLETGKKLEAWTEESGMNPEEVGEYAEGDLRFDQLGRNALVAETAKWPGAEVPYEINGYFSGPDRKMIANAIAAFDEYTCIKFRPRTSNDKDWISLVSGNSGCWSSVGKIGGKQEVNLQSPGCLTKVGTPIHELMHALGFVHEQNRWERDEHVRINWNNIQSGRNNNFEKAKKDQTNGHGVDYDFQSVLHYSANAFSANGQPTIVPVGSQQKMGQRDGFSQGDLIKLRRMYCASREVRA